MEKTVLDQNTGLVWTRNANLPGRQFPLQGNDNAGIYLDAGKIGVLASQGLEGVEVYIKPRVAVMPSGEEVVELGKELKSGQLLVLVVFELLLMIHFAQAQSHHHRQ